ncbi:MAG: ABC-2 transporter permease [Bacteroidales bacterium]
MWKLLRKDLILNRRMLAISYGFWSVLWLGLPMRDIGKDFSLGMWAGLVSVACAFLPIMTVSREDKFKASSLSCSLPVTRRDIVASRYIGGWLLALAAAAVAVGAMLLLLSIRSQPLVDVAPTLPLKLLGIIGILIALMMPFVLRFGVGGVIGLLVALQVVGILTLLASALFGGGPVPALESAVRGAIDAARGLRRAVGTAAFSLVALSAVAALNVASYRLSVLIYRKREF